MYEIIFSKVSDLFFSSIYFSSNFTSDSNTKLQTRHFLIKKTLAFCKGRNSSRRYVNADLQAAFQNVLQNRCS